MEEEKKKKQKQNKKREKYSINMEVKVILAYLVQANIYGQKVIARYRERLLSFF